MPDFNRFTHKFKHKRLKLGIALWMLISLVTAAALILPAAQPADASDRPLVLLYHHIDHKVSQWHVTPEKFETQLKFLAQNGYHTISMETYMNAVQHNGALPDKPIVITFDDGGADNFTYALPLLQRYGMTATFFIVSEWVGTKGFMTWNEVVALKQAGMEIGAHTMHHLFLTHLPVWRQFLEIFIARLTIELHIKSPVMFFAYPYNDHNKMTVTLTRFSGFWAALAVAPHKSDVSNDPLEIPRATVLSGEGMNTFMLVVRGGLVR